MARFDQGRIRHSDVAIKLVFFQSLDGIIDESCKAFDYEACQDQGLIL